MLWRSRHRINCCRRTGPPRVDLLALRRLHEAPKTFNMADAKKIAKCTKEVCASSPLIKIFFPFLS